MGTSFTVVQTAALVCANSSSAGEDGGGEQGEFLRWEQMSAGTNRNPNLVQPDKLLNLVTFLNRQGRSEEHDSDSLLWAVALKKEHSVLQGRVFNAVVLLHWVQIPHSSDSLSVGITWQMIVLVARDNFSWNNFVLWEKRACSSLPISSPLWLLFGARLLRSPGRNGITGCCCTNIH